MTRSQKKRLLRQATQMRIREERAVMEVAFEGFDGEPALVLPRLEEPSALRMLKNVPSVFAFAEKLNKRYDRPLWASQRYGAK